MTGLVQIFWSEVMCNNLLVKCSSSRLMSEQRAKQWRDRSKLLSCYNKPNHKSFTVVLWKHLLSSTLNYSVIGSNWTLIMNNRGNSFSCYYLSRGAGEETWVDGWTSVSGGKMWVPSLRIIQLLHKQCDSLVHIAGSNWTSSGWELEPVRASVPNTYG